MRARMTPWIFVAAIVAPVTTTALQAKADLVILVRHAEKASSADDAGLTPAGRERAEALAESLAHVRLAAILTSQYPRTAFTAEPAARRQSLTPHAVVSKGDVPAHAAAVAAALDELPDGSAALVVGHSNTIGPIIAALGGPAVPGLCDAEFATLYVLQRGGASKQVQLLKTRYGAPDPPDAESCRQGR